MRLLKFSLVFFAAVSCATGDGFSSSAQEPVAPARWNESNTVALIDFIQAVDAHGLRAEDYSAAQLSDALARRDWVAVDAAARARFRTLAHDLAVGTPRAVAPAGWRFDAPAIESEEFDAAIETALSTGAIAETLGSFEPRHAAYLALKKSLTETAGERRETIRVNMDRWRRMPRDLGASYIFVNIPAFEAAIYSDGEEVARHRVIVGARKTPTPQFAALVKGVVFNPTWFVPPSIVAESVGSLLKNSPAKAQAQGYYVAADGGVRQRPGPQNALGRMKLVMANPYSVFIHDTPQKRLFDKDDRALSHGCVRIEGALDFAATLLRGAFDRAMIDEIVATGAGVTVELDEPLSVYIGYFTAHPAAEGLAFYDDVYQLDRTHAASAKYDERRGECPPDES